MDPLTLFGLLAVTAMLVTYALEARSPWFVLAFAGACLLGSAYGFLQGAWPFGLVEAVWSAVAARRWWLGGGGWRGSLHPDVRTGSQSVGIEDRDGIEARPGRDPAGGALGGDGR